MRRWLRGDAPPGLLAPSFQGGAGKNCWDGVMRLHARIPPTPFLVTDRVGNAEHDRLRKAALPRDRFNLVFSHLFGLDLSTGVVCAVLERSSHCPVPCPTRAGPSAPGYWPASVGCCRWGEREALPQGSSDPLLPGQEWQTPVCHIDSSIVSPGGETSMNRERRRLKSCWLSVFNSTAANLDYNREGIREGSARGFVSFLWILLP